MHTTRRDFLRTTGLGALLLSGAGCTMSLPFRRQGPPLRFGLIADVHHMAWKKDESARLRAFIDAAIAHRSDFILQLGDFCLPENPEPLLAEWNRFTGPRHHVLGNHDMDQCDKATIMKLWGMPAPFYSFDAGGVHFVVLDRNCIRNADGTFSDYNRANYARKPAPDINCTSSAQLDWLANDLATTRLPVLVFLHQPVNYGNGADIVAALEKANKTAGWTQVFAVVAGHDHIDFLEERDGIRYLTINSSSYHYLNPQGPQYYVDPLFALVTLDPAAGTLHLAGRSTTYVPGNTAKAAPVISDRDWPLPG